MSEIRDRGGAMREFLPLIHKGSESSIDTAFNEHEI